jgi:hypothetical protein
MSPVEVTVSGTVGAATQPLAISNTTATLNVQTGVAVPETVLATVTGGVQPYSYTLDTSITNPGTVPNGLALDENAGVGVIGISGTPTDPAGTPINFGVIVTDASGAQAKLSVGSGAAAAAKKLRL